MIFHAIPRGRLCSLRRALLMWLLPVFLLVGAVAVYVAHWNYHRMVGSFMDDQMVALAQTVAAQGDEVLLPAQTHERLHERGSYAVQLFGPDGQLRSSSWPLQELGLQSLSGFANLEADGAHWRVYTEPPPQGNAAQRVQIFQSGEFRRHVIAERALSSITPLLLVLPLSMLILWGVIAMVTRDVGAVAREVSAQDENNLSELSLDRVPGEIAPLVTAFNSLLLRLREAFATQRRFVQDAAHELRTPIAAVGLQLENLRGDLAVGAPAERFAQLEAGVLRAQRLVDQLLRLSRQEAPSAAYAPAAVNVQQTLQDSIGTLIALADRRGIDLGLEPGLGEQCAAACTLNCHAGDLRSAIDNLVENALRHTPEGGVVDVRPRIEGGLLVIEVVDCGPGIPEELLERVFDRFYRLPGGDARGSGLGLSIARAAAERCGLELTLRNRHDCSGLIARLAQKKA